MNLHYKSEHTACLFYATEETEVFHRYHLAEGQSVQPDNRAEGLILYVLSGSVGVLQSGVLTEVVDHRCMIFLSPDDRCQLQALSKASFLTCSFAMHMSFCTRYNFANLLNDFHEGLLKGSSSGSLLPQRPLSVNARLCAFFMQLDATLADGLGCIHYHDLKRQELLLLLRAYHSKEELYALFSGVLRRDNRFKQFVLQNYLKVADVNEFASLANMSVRSFQRKFKAEFGSSLRDWLLARKAERVLHELRTTDRSLIDIAMDFGFSAMSYFTTFCKNNFGLTPSELRGQRRDTPHVPTQSGGGNRRLPEGGWANASLPMEHERLTL